MHNITALTLDSFSISLLLRHWFDKLNIDIYSTMLAFVSGGERVGHVVFGRSCEGPNRNNTNRQLCGHLFQGLKRLVKCNQKTD